MSVFAVSALATSRLSRLFRTPFLFFLTGGSNARRRWTPWLAPSPSSERWPCRAVVADVCAFFVYTCYRVFFTASSVFVFTRNRTRELDAATYSVKRAICVQIIPSCLHDFHSSFFLISDIYASISDKLNSHEFSSINWCLFAFFLSFAVTRRLHKGLAKRIMSDISGACKTRSRYGEANWRVDTSVLSRYKHIYTYALSRWKTHGVRSRDLDFRERLFLIAEFPRRCASGTKQQRARLSYVGNFYCDFYVYLFKPTRTEGSPAGWFKR